MAAEARSAIQRWGYGRFADALEAAAVSPRGVAVAPAPERVQLPEKARAGIEVLRDVVEKLLTTSRYVDEEGEATLALADMASCIADPPFRLATSGVLGASAGPVMRPISDKEIEQIAGRDELTGDAILDFAHRLLEAAANPPTAGVRVPDGGPK